MAALETGVIGTLILLLGFGGQMVLEPLQYEFLYYCPSNDAVGVFHTVSADGSVAFAVDDAGSVTRACAGGWQDFAQKAAQASQTYVPLETACDERGCHVTKFAPVATGDEHPQPSYAISPGPKPQQRPIPLVFDTASPDAGTPSAPPALVQGAITQTGVATVVTPQGGKDVVFVIG